MRTKKLSLLFVLATCILCLAARSRADETPLTEMDPDTAKEYGGKLTEQFNKEFKQLPVKIEPDADKAVGITNADTHEGILLVPLKGFREESEGPKDAEKDNGIGLCYVFMSPSFKPLADGKPADGKRVRTMKFKDSEGNEVLEWEAGKEPSGSPPRVIIGAPPAQAPGLFDQPAPIKVS